ncbi:hypothetical protein AB0M20_29715 [Actinoplanes sp. NPDC051633]|uniref:hypothetical protein n=1 Tax=Actinoplanes sp. NPDC051633 TaxID=3155670 RepID=UPI003415937A
MLLETGAYFYDLDMLGVHYAVTAKQERALLAANGDDGVGEYVGDLKKYGRTTS